MRLRNKKTGQLGNFIINKYHFECVDLEYVPEYRNLAELTADWEDVPEPKEFWYIGQDGIIFSDVDTVTQDYANRLVSIGNYFETKEEAEKAVEKLKAWKRLEDKGLEFEGWRTWEEVTGLSCFDKGVAHSYYAGFTFRSEDRLEKDIQVKADLELLLGGEE